MNQTQTEPLLPSTFQPYLNRKGLERWANDHIEDRLSTEPTLDLLEQLTKLDTVVSIMKDRVRERVKVEYAGNPGSYGNLNIGFKGGRKTYDYSRDPIWKQIKQELEDREAFLNSLKEPLDILVEDQVITVYPPLIKYGQDSINVTLK